MKNQFPRNIKTIIVENGLLFVLSFLFALFTFDSTSPIFSFEGDDSIIFKSMGLAILNGLTPYVDYFDHKGPILYLINAFGQFFVSGSLGIFIIEIIATYVVFSCWLQVAKLLSSNVIFIWSALLVAICIYQLTGKGGNTCEEWELLAISPALLFSLRFIIEDCVSISRLGRILGFCFAFCFLIRPNDAVSQIGGFSIGILAFVVKRRTFKELVHFIVWWVVGFSVLFLPVVLFFVSRGALADFFYGLIGHNVIYSGSFWQGMLLPRKLSMLVFVAFFGIYLFRYSFRIKNYYYVLIVIFSSLLGGCFLLGDRMYSHYFTVMIPVLLAISVFFFCSEKKKIKVLFLLVMVSFVLFDVITLQNLIWRVQGERVHNQNERLERSFQKEARLLINNVPKEEQDSIWNFNLSFNRFVYTGIFWHNGIIQMNRIPLYQMTLVDTLLRKTDNMESQNPMWVTLTHESDQISEGRGIRLYEYFKPGYDFIADNYELIARTDTLICDIELWRRLSTSRD